MQIIHDHAYKNLASIEGSDSSLPASCSACMRNPKQAWNKIYCLHTKGRYTACVVLFCFQAATGTCSTSYMYQLPSFCMYRYNWGAGICTLIHHIILQGRMIPSPQSHCILTAVRGTLHHITDSQCLKAQHKPRSRKRLGEASEGEAGLQQQVWEWVCMITIALQSCKLCA